jgi:hypothetical protein
VFHRIPRNVCDIGSNRTPFFGHPKPARRCLREESRLSRIMKPLHVGVNGSVWIADHQVTGGGFLRLEGAHRQEQTPITAMESIPFAGLFNDWLKALSQRSPGFFHDFPDL